MEKGKFRKERDPIRSDRPINIWMIEATLELAEKLGVHVSELASLGASIEYILPGSVGPGIELDEGLVVLRFNGSVVSLCSQTQDKWGWWCTQSENIEAKNEA